MFRIKKNKKGFTLIELLVVIAIIGILAGIVLVSLGGARSKARDARRQSDMHQAVVAQEMYYGDKGYYFSAATQEGIPAIDVYLPALADPQTASNYRWLVNTSCTDKFCAYAKLENKLGTCANISVFVAYEGGTRTVCSSATLAEPGTGCGCATAAW